MTIDSFLLRLDHVSKQYSSPDGSADISILQDVSLTLQAGDSLAILGPSGSGKSTLLNIIGAMDRPSSGAVYYQNRNIADLDENALASMRNQYVGFVFQAHHLLPQLSVWENVLLPNLPLGREEKQVTLRAERLLQRVNLSHRLHHRPAQLSGGECQRVAVVRSLINQPLLLLADEPTGSLDQKTAAELGELLLQLNQEENMACVIVTHSPALASRAQMVRQLVDGRLLTAEMS